ncbi:hypothetical protein C349_06249 [Cryptococcus neoformans var. grubii Br795]|nr:hypothetical protein C353_06190 [Cryptococcus neoformans var. grubii AD1-83a]OXG47890.1 hypothetical protein C354_06175 [Cryptococcus neoformans var. grubii MW-RSA1955]OXG51506.1 hypothetical protein C352_06198 [Cryptococcus neoformans var. grubii CHC193]OXG57833.1 hypothetical protein C351_06276 [Cryptococcus neoformans var. grubii c8]OXG74221.1 hypothetical protein C349_06249 [Cryptococcus neoformans var. grubii Br795]OXG78099.1 hypothetical protein C346_06177 [Cryptococcus neoformans var
MPSVAILLPIIGAISVTATGISEPHHMSLISRQLDSSTIPAACQPTCQSAMSIYSDCTSNDISGCRQVCQQSTFNEFIDCLDCTSEQLAMTTSEQSLLNSAVEQLKDVCGQTGSSVTGTLAGVSSTTNPILSGSAATSATSAVSDILGFTSAASGITIGSAASGTASAAVITTPSSAGVATNAATSDASSGGESVASAAYPAMGGKLVGPGVAALAVIAGALFFL